MFASIVAYIESMALEVFDISDRPIVSLPLTADVQGKILSPSDYTSTLLSLPNPLTSCIRSQGFTPLM